MQVQTDILSTLSDFTWLKQTVTRDLHLAFVVDFSLSSNISPKSKNCAKLDICTAQHDKPSVSNLLAQSLFNIIFSPRKIKYRKKGHFVVMQLKLGKGPFSKSTIRENYTQIFCFGELQYNITKTFLLRKFLCQSYTCFVPTLVTICWIITFLSLIVKVPIDKYICIILCTFSKDKFNKTQVGNFCGKVVSQVSF